MLFFTPQILIKKGLEPFQYHETLENRGMVLSIRHDVEKNNTMQNAMKK
ncbi:hypothetical protein EBME_0694 [bacterium endosymbiont of Mortierella elongata FMR23-6]|nr:hypothetical protein EBME_0694 [bacterium endosymbiont of Mortierella elongata FMR23-6]